MRRDDQAAGLLERHAELAAIEAALVAARRGDGSVILIEGEAGIGKSTLLEAAVAMARDERLLVLRGHGGELERQYVNGVAVDLFGPVLRSPADRSQRLTGLAAAAAPLFAHGPTSSDDDPLGPVNGLYWLCVELTADGPVLIAVDDAHWADAGSARFLAYLGRRIRELPVVLLLTMRPPEAAELPELHDLRGLRTAQRLSPERLSPSAVATLLRADGGPADAAAVDACWTATRGNPMYVRELARHPDAASTLMTGDAAPEPLARAIRHRLGLLDDASRRVAEAVAILGDEASPARVARLGGLDARSAHDVLRRLTDASVLERGAALAFSHPIVRGAIYGAMPPTARAHAHHRAGLLLSGEGATPDTVAAQLLRSEATGDPRVVQLLRDGAQVARAQGEPGTAVSYLERALREPPGPEERPEIVAELAGAEAATGSSTAPDRYLDALALARSDVTRAALQLERGHALIAAADWAGAAAAFREGLELVGRRDPALAARLEADYVAASWVSMTAGPEVDRILERVERAEAVTPEQRELLISRAFQQASAVRGSAEELAATVLAAIDGVEMDELVRAGQTIELAAGVLCTTDALDAELDMLTRAVEAVPLTGRYAKLGVYSYCRAWPNYFKGNLVDAAADAQAAVEAHHLGWETFFPVASAVLALAHLDRGEIEAATATIDAVDPSEWSGRIDMAIFVPLARGRVLLEQGDASAAADQILAAGAAAESVGLRTPGPPEWRSWAAVALARSAQRSRARTIAAEGLEIAREWGAMWPLAIALRALGAVTPGRPGLALLEEAVAMARSSPARLEEARTLVKFGEALRRRGMATDARRVLAEGIDLAHRLGALGLMERARRELTAAGGRPRRYAVTGRAALTPAEARVADLVAAGRTNRQVAEALFVTPKAVEYHLANAYRKLQISGRGELAASLHEDAPATDG